MNVHSEATFFTGLKEHMAQHISDSMEAEIDAACVRLRTELNKRVGQLALNVLNHYSAETHGRELRITVKLPEKI